MKIFVSYTTQDGSLNKTNLCEINNALCQFGQVFIDLIHNTNEGQERVMNELRKSDILILLESNKTYESEWVKIELGIAKERGIPIIKTTFNEIFNKSKSELILLIESFTNTKLHFI